DPDISYFHVFRFPVFIHNRKDHLGKFDKKADNEIFLGYSKVSKSFRVGDMNFNVTRSFPGDEFSVPRNPITKNQRYENFTPYVPTYDPLSTNNINLVLEPTTTEPENVTPETELPNSLVTKHYPITNQLDEQESYALLNDEVIPDQIISNNEVIPDVIPPPTPPVNNLVTPTPQYRWSKEKHIKSVNILGEPNDGVTTRSRVIDPEVHQLKQGLDTGSAPYGKTIIGTKWIFRFKIDENGVVIRNKARIFLAYATYRDFRVYQMDMKSDFLNGKLCEEVYVHQPWI
ncbi:retrovirus-related pol polyprotein from transposon TNT 1-94, partial [Tanacetum coccineum]